MAEALLHRILDAPRGFDVWQSAVGAPGSKRRFVAEHVRPQAGERVLDIGCGTGALLEYMPTGVSYVGVDVDQGYIDAARARFGDRGAFVCADFTTFDPQEPFDVAIAYGVFHHLDDAQAPAGFDVATRALAPGRRLVIAEPCRTREQGAFERFLMRHDRGKFIRTEDEYARLARTAFPEVTTRLAAGTYRIPFTLVVLEARLADPAPAREENGQERAGGEA